MKKLNIREKTVDFPEGEFTVFLNKGCVVNFTILQKKVLQFHCANHSDEPLRAEIMFSKGFHDF